MQQHCLIQLAACQSVHFIVFVLYEEKTIFIYGPQTEHTLEIEQQETYQHQAVTKSNSATARVTKRYRKLEFRGS